MDEVVFDDSIMIYNDDFTIADKDGIAIVDWTLDRNSRG